MSTPSTERRQNSAAIDLAEYVEHFRARVIQDAINTATSSYWLRRAETFENARHRPGIDYAGNATTDRLRTKWYELTEIAQGCRNRATVSLLQTDIDPAVIETLSEAA